MNIFSRIKSGIQAFMSSWSKPAYDSRTQSANPRNWRPFWVPRADFALQNSELIFAAATRIANTLASMPVRLYKNLDPITNELNDIVSSSPNSNMTSHAFFKTIESSRCASGNGYALKIVDTNENVVSLKPLNSERVAPIIEETTGELWYRIQTDDYNEMYLHNYYVIHVQFASTNGIVGVNPVTVLFNTLKYSADIEKFSREQLEKGVNAAIVAESPANLGEEQRKKVIAAMLNAYQETEGNILFLESGVTAKALNLSPVDTKLFEVEKISRSKVALVYNIPPNLMGDFSGANVTTQEQQMLEFLQLCMLPIVTMYEQELNRKLLSRAQRMEGYRWRFDMSALVRADAATMAEVNYKAVRSAWKTPNEIRAEYGLPPVENGSTLVISRDMIPLNVTVGNPELLLRKGGGTR